MPLVTVSSASEISIANQCHDLKLPYPIKILCFTKKTMKDAELKLQRYVGCKVWVKRKRLIQHYQGYTVSQKDYLLEPKNNRKTLHRINSFTEDNPLSELLNTSIPVLQWEIKFLRTQCNSLCHKMMVCIWFFNCSIVTKIVRAFVLYIASC